MSKLIVGIVTLVALAILIILNVDYKSTINLFGARLENVSVIVIAIAGFILGIVYSGVLFLINLIDKRRRTKQKKTGQGLKEKEAQLKEREESVAAQADQQRGGADHVADAERNEAQHSSEGTAKASTRIGRKKKSRSKD